MTKSKRMTKSGIRFYKVAADVRRLSNHHRVHRKNEPRYLGCYLLWARGLFSLSSPEGGEGRGEEALLWGMPLSPRSFLAGRERPLARWSSIARSDAVRE